MLQCTQKKSEGRSRKDIEVKNDQQCAQDNSALLRAITESITCLH